MTKRILPPATIGIVGGGQLGQMLALAAKPMGYQVIVLDPQVDAPAALVADQQIVASYDDVSALRNLANQADVVTYEFENVDQTALQTAVPAEKLPQGVALLNITANRLREKQFWQRWAYQLPHSQPWITWSLWTPDAMKYRCQQF